MRIELLCADLLHYGSKPVSRRDEAERRAQLLRTIRDAAAAGVDYIQLREKDLAIGDLELLAREVLPVIRAAGRSRLLINHRTDVALAVGADGVHLASTDIRRHPRGVVVLSAKGPCPGRSAEYRGRPRRT